MSTRPARKRNVAISVAVLVIGTLAFLAVRLVIADHGQCDRRCRERYGARTRGTRAWLAGTTCGCTRDGESLADVTRRNAPTGPRPPGTTVCGADHVTYESDSSARGHTTVLHAGGCGACSNAGDIAAYRRTAATLTATAETCAFRTTLFGDAVGRACFADRSGLSEPCVDCWIANMNCTASHCLGVCLAAKLTGAPRNRPDGRLNDCLACDEAYCGAMFTECAGANRRRAGITSDIGRPDTQIWRDNDAFNR